MYITGSIEEVMRAPKVVSTDRWCSRSSVNLSWLEILKAAVYRRPTRRGGSYRQYNICSVGHRSRILRDSHVDFPFRIVQRCGVLHGRNYTTVLYYSI